MPQVSSKEQILDAAVAALHEKGFNGSSVQDITTAAQVPKGSFYNHFQSKEAVAIEALDRYWGRVLTATEELGDATISPLDRLRRYFGRMGVIARAHDYRDGCFIGNMSAEMAGQSAAVRERLAVLLAAWTRAIEACVRDAQAEGSLRRDLDAKTVAAFLLNAWEGAVIRSKVDKNDVALAAFEAAVFTLLIP